MNACVALAGWLLPQALARRLEEAVLSGADVSPLVLQPPPASRDGGGGVGASSPQPPPLAAPQQQQQAQLPPAPWRSSSQQGESLGGSSRTSSSALERRQVPPAMLSRATSQPVLPSSQSQRQVETAAAAAAAATEASALDVVAAAWLTLVAPLAGVARTDDRPQVADAAAVVLLSVFKTHCATLEAPQWQQLYISILLPLLALPPAAVPAVAGTEANGVRSSSDGDGSSSRRGWLPDSALLLPAVVPTALSAAEGLDRRVVLCGL